MPAEMHWDVHSKSAIMRTLLNRIGLSRQVRSVPVSDRIANIPDKQLRANALRNTKPSGGAKAVVLVTLPALP
jgi:hypothetical protein